MSKRHPYNRERKPIKSDYTKIRVENWLKLIKNGETKKSICKREGISDTTMASKIQKYYDGELI